MQKSLNVPVRFDGVGLHSGQPVSMTVYPAAANFGIQFNRTDVSGHSRILARWDYVETETRLCTKLLNTAGLSVSTVEHVMAALAGCGIHNALIDISGPEVPILDGSSKPFVEAFLKAGLKTQIAPVGVIKVLKRVSVQNGESIATLEPMNGFEIDFQIEFDDPAIGHQAKTLCMSNGSFVRELCDSRTFCRQTDVDAMRAAGLALGGSLENAVVIDHDKVLSPGGLRHSDEAVRHKMLDALGDLYLAGAPLLGRYTGFRAGHALTNQLLRAVFSDPEAFEFVTCTTELALRLPGVGVSASDLPAAA